MLKTIDLYLDILQFEQTLYESEFLNEGILKQISSHVSNRLVDANKLLNKYGINIEELISKSKKFVTKKAIEYYKKGYSISKAGKAITSEILKLIKPYLKKALKKFQEMNLAAKIILQALLALAVIAVVVILNTNGILLLQSMGFSLYRSVIMVAVALGPALEEAMKTFFISMKMPWVGVALFVSIETILQGMIMISDFSKLPFFLLQRAGTSMMHFVTTYMQKDRGEKEKEKGSTTAERLFKMWVVGFLAHALFNIIVIMRNEDFYKSLFDPGSWRFWVKQLGIG